MDPTFWPSLIFCGGAALIITAVMFLYEGDAMSIEQMREAITKAYPGGTWAGKVAKMSDAQVAATYQRMMNAGKLK